jgi:hypothetical protein
MKKVGVSSEEKKLTYYKYFEKEMAEIPLDKIQILNNGPESSDKGLPFEKKDLFLSGDDNEFCQTGYGIREDGTGFVCNTTYMPGVTSEMLDWWFPWQSIGSDLRYKIWDPEDHYFSRADNVEYVCNPEIPLNEKTWGVNHYILEDIGSGPVPLKLCFKSPVDFGYNPELIGTDKCQSMVCAIGESSVAAAATHKWYLYKDGVLFCSRFWIGFAQKNGEIEKAIPNNVKIPVEVAKGLFAHNIKEFSNLTAILPSLYEEEKDSF